MKFDTYLRIFLFTLVALTLTKYAMYRSKVPSLGRWAAYL